MINHISKLINYGLVFHLNRGENRGFPLRICSKKLENNVFLNTIKKFSYNANNEFIFWAKYLRFHESFTIRIDSGYNWKIKNKKWVHNWSVASNGMVYTLDWCPHFIVWRERAFFSAKYTIFIIRNSFLTE